MSRKQSAVEDDSSSFSDEEEQWEDLEDVVEEN